MPADRFTAGLKERWTRRGEAAAVAAAVAGKIRSEGDGEGECAGRV